MNRSRHLITLLEDIAGTAAIVYHRTGANAFSDATGKNISGKDIPKSIITQGFAEGKDGAYGPGIYATYTLNAQLRAPMSPYGAYLVKCRVSLQGYLILDYIEAKKVYKNNYTLRAQLSQYYSSWWLDEEAAWIVACETQLQHRPYETTSNIATGLYREHQINTVVPGMLFTGQRDGTIVVTYEPRDIVPIAYAHHPVGTRTPVAWTAFDAPTYISHVRKGGLLLRVPPVGKRDARSADSLQRLGRLTKLSRKDLYDKLRKMTSLTLEYKSILYEPDFNSLPPSFVTMLKKKFQHPHLEFSRVIAPILDRRLERSAKDTCKYLQHILPTTSMTCHPTKTHTIGITFTFPTVPSVLVFLNFFLSKETYDPQPLVDFFRAETPRTRENLSTSLLGGILSPETSLTFPLTTYLHEFVSLVQQAPPTKYVL